MLLNNYLVWFYNLDGFPRYFKISRLCDIICDINFVSLRSETSLIR